MELLMSGKKWKKSSGFLNYGPKQEDFFNLLSIKNKDLTVKKTFLKEYPDLNNGNCCKKFYIFNNFSFLDPERSHLFQIPANDEIGTDLGNIFVEIDLEVVKENGDKLTAENKEKGDMDNIQPTNDFFNALFSDIQVSINGVHVGDTNSYHPQIALLHNMLEYDENFQVS